MGRVKLNLSIMKPLLLLNLSDIVTNAEEEQLHITSISYKASYWEPLEIGSPSVGHFNKAAYRCLTKKIWFTA